MFSAPRSIVAVVAMVGCGSAASGGGEVGNVAEPSASAWTIEDGRVGDIVTGLPMPGRMLGEEALVDRYVREFDYYRWIEGYRYADPPITVVMEIDTGNPAAAVAAARNGTVVDTVIIHGVGPMTARGIGVGSTLDEVGAAYAEVGMVGLGDGDCVATSPELPSVSFQFVGCADETRAHRVNVHLLEE